ncbi:Ankyrin repeat and SOCS box protein 2 [Triplophysa tibetana]|uniref:Ankyrin repeat and SOCS box protein 2 n=1 Tax=Triplophysa tibetana TaxID=1572043 RepID=A0A5A9NL90_9TELE|nr:Ankyrin repeat and SOCS box protein 2 [Triplophysa tibetana]
MTITSRDLKPVEWVVSGVVKYARAAAGVTSSACESEDWTDLHEAAHRGHADALRALLKAQHTCVDKRTLHEQTPLLLAVHAGHLDCVRFLLEAGADPDICNKNKETPLYKACEQECVRSVKLLLVFGASVNQRCHRGRTALHETVRRDHTELCETLLKARASIDARDADDITPLIEAAGHGRTQTLTCLIRNGAGVNVQSYDGNTALSEACRHGHTDAVKVLLQHHADANTTSREGLLPLHVATQHGHTQIVCLLMPISSRSKVRQSGISPLHVAAEHDRRDILRLLIESGCDVNTRLSDERSSMFPDRRVTALYCAIAAGNTQTAAMLLNAGADPNTDPFSPLLLAVRHGCLKSVALLVEHGADVNARPSEPATDFPGVLLYASHLNVLRCLLDNGCDAQSCFKCDRHHADHNWPPVHFTPVNTSQRSLVCTKPALQFCEWMCSSSWSQRAGAVIHVLLDYVGNVQMCSRMTDLLQRSHEWLTIKEKTSSPRPLMHLSRLKIREQMGSQRLSSVNTLPLPNPMLSYVCALQPTGSSAPASPPSHGHTHRCLDLNLTKNSN